MDFSKFTSDLHASERRIRPAQESSQLKREDRGVCGLNILRFSLFNFRTFGASVGSTLQDLKPAQQSLRDLRAPVP